MRGEFGISKANSLVIFLASETLIILRPHMLRHPAALRRDSHGLPQRNHTLRGNDPHQTPALLSVVCSSVSIVRFQLSSSGLKLSEPL